MQRLEVSGAVRLIYKSLGIKGLISVLRRSESSATRSGRVINGKGLRVPTEKSQVLHRIHNIQFMSVSTVHISKCVHVFR